MDLARYASLRASAVSLRTVRSEGAVRRVAALHGGGNAPAMDAALEGLVSGFGRDRTRIWGIRGGWSGLTSGRTLFVPLSRRAIRGIRTSPGSLLGTGLRNRGLFDPGEDQARRLARALKTLKSFDQLVVIGGDGSGLVAERLFREYGIRTLLIPTSIDGFPEMPSVGFESAVRRGVELMGSYRAVADTNNRVMIIETMGRDSGALALHIGIEGRADVVLIPEVRMSRRDLYQRIRKALEKGNGCVILVSEGIQRGIGKTLAMQIERDLGVQATPEFLGYLLRGADPAKADIEGGLEAGAAAADAILKGVSGVIIPPEARPIMPIPLTEFFSGARARRALRLELAEQWRARFGNR